MGAIVGVGVCGWEAIEENYRAILLEGKNRAGIFTVPKVMPGAAAGQVSMNLGLRGPVFGVTSACSSSNHAIASAVDQIRLGRADVMLAGGTDAPLVWGVLKGWEALRVLAPDTCRPFSADRQGLVLGEGAGMAVLETYEHAMARGATILAELAGAGLSADASDIVAPTIEGPEAAMRFCLADAGLNPEDVDYLNAHGTGTKANDQIETAAIKRVFGDHADSAVGVVDQVDACPLPRRIGRAGDDRLRDGDPRRHRAADGEFSRSRPRLRPRRDAECGARAQGARRDQQRLRLRRHQCGACVQGSLTARAPACRRLE